MDGICGSSERCCFKALRAGRAASGVYEIFMQLIIAEALRNMN